MTSVSYICFLDIKPVRVAPTLTKELGLQT